MSRKRWYDSSRCPKGRFHDFKQVLDNAEATKEACVLCGVTKVWRKRPGGRMADDAEYLRWHVRRFCQPLGSTRAAYAEIHGSKRLREAEAGYAAHAAVPDSWGRTTDEAIRYLQSLTIDRQTI